MASKFIHLFAIAVIFTVVSAQDTIEVVAQYKGKIELSCSDLGDGVSLYAATTLNGNESLSKLEVNNKIEIDGSTKTYTLKDLRREDLERDYRCQTEAGVIKRKFKLNIAPYLFKPEKTSQTVTESGSVEIECRLLYGSDSNVNVSWTWVKDDNATVESDNKHFIIERNADSTKLRVENVTDSDKGTYQCKATNQHGSHSETVRLRVKDTLAALWPFLGIVAEVIVLCLIILIYEKKCNKKPSNSEEDNEAAQNLMGKDGNTSDVKKRTVKA